MKVFKKLISFIAICLMSSSLFATDITLPSGELSVAAKDENPAAQLTNKTSVCVVLEVNASGSWSFGTVAGTGPWNANGDTNKWDGPLRWKNLPAGSLVAMINGDANSPMLIGVQKAVNLSPNDTLTLLMNDEPKVYGDNSGSLNIKWAMKDVCSTGENK